MNQKYRESQLIVQAIEKTLVDIKNYKKEHLTEAAIQCMLYLNLCKKMGNKNFSRISSEYSVYNNSQKENNKKYAKKEGKNKDYFNDIKKSSNYTLAKGNQLFNDIIIGGKYDLVVFNRKKTKISHLIEIKRLQESEIHPENASRHRPIEDLFVLTDLVSKDYSNRSEELERDCKSYNLEYIIKRTKNPKTAKDYEKIKKFIKDVKKAYETAGIDYIAIGFEDNVAKNLGFDKPLIGGKLDNYSQWK